MSKWLNDSKFELFQNEKIEEKDNVGNQIGSVFFPIWKTPEKGSVDTPKTYIGRFLPDSDSTFYVKYFYHMFKIGDHWVFFKCDKTESFNNYCPWCSVTSKLYQGTQAEKDLAYSFKRKTKFAANFFIIEDPRDVDKDDDNKVSGTVRLYEFPEKVEKMVKDEIIDRSEGRGKYIFDPGKDGYNFIIKVYSTKKDEKGKVWPDYSNSKFARNSEPIGTDDKIEEIMKKTVNLNDYLESLKKDDSIVKKCLKEAMVWDLVEDEWKRFKEVGTTIEKDFEDSKLKDVEEDADSDQIDDDFSEEDLLKELEDL